MAAQSIEIVSHVFCPPGVTQYAEHLKWQWASLTLYPPSVPTVLSVCHTGTDEYTCQRLEAMQAMISERRSHPMVSLHPVQMKRCQLFRRAIGRNWCATRSEADIVWYCDVDYVFGPDCLTRLAELMDADSGLSMPSTLWMSKDLNGRGGNRPDHAIGDKMVVDNLDNDLPTIDESLFASRRQRICIGGCQIVGGNLARRIGYLGDNPKWMKPVDESKGFLSCRGDKMWRRSNKLSAKRLDIPSVYRIRHSTDGRDFDAAGENKGKLVWK